MLEPKWRPASDITLLKCARACAWVYAWNWARPCRLGSIHAVVPLDCRKEPQLGLRCASLVAQMTIEVASILAMDSPQRQRVVVLVLFVLVIKVHTCGDPSCPPQDCNRSIGCLSFDGVLYMSFGARP